MGLAAAKLNWSGACFKQVHIPGWHALPTGVNKAVLDVSVVPGMAVLLSGADRGCSDSRRWCEGWHAPRIRLKSFTFST
jgi:hypothetical protein